MTEKGKKMYNAVSSTTKYSVKFAIRTDDNRAEPEKSRIWFEVLLFDHVAGISQENNFQPEEYGKACDLYDSLSREMESKYGKERRYVPSIVCEDLPRECCCACRIGDQ